jgi:NTE family protein
MRVGLAFGGGGARGLAHIGALSVLLRERIPVDCVSGVSAGAVMGAVYCAGMPIEQVRAMVPHMRWRRLASRARSRQGLFRFDKLERWLIMLLGDIDFADLEKPLAVITMDATTGERVVLRNGRVARAVRASCSVPGCVTPVEVEGRQLVDGGPVDNLPVEAAREMGADFVIGVDISQPKYERSWGPLGPGVAAIEAMLRNAGGGVSTADHLIVPKLAGQSYLRFSAYRQLMALGEAAAEESLPCLLGELRAAERAAAG